MGNKSTHAWNVMVVHFVTMGNRKRFTRIVVVVRCARPHIALRAIIPNMMDTVYFALSICFQMSLLHGATRRKRTMWQFFLKKSSPMSPGSVTRG